MTDQPIDHRKQAERFITWAVDPDELEPHNTPDDQVLYALIGIGHALLAGPPERILERRMEALAQLFTAGGPMPTAAAVRAALRGEQMVR